MKRYIKILSFLMLLFVLTAEDCSDISHESTPVDQQFALFNEIEEDFKTELLNQDQLSGFEDRSLQMLEDLVDYLNVCVDTGLSVEFRQQARQMLNDLFVDETEIALLFNEINVEEENETGALHLKNGNSGTFVVSSGSIVSKLQKSYGKDYSGVVQYNLSLSGSETVFENQINIILKKTKKQFGNETALVWELFFTVD